MARMATAASRWIEAISVACASLRRCGTILQFRARGYIIPGICRGDHRWLLGITREEPHMRIAALALFGMRRPEPPHAQKLRDAARILAVGLDHHCRKRRSRLKCFSMAETAAGSRGSASL